MLTWALVGFVWHETGKRMDRMADDVTNLHGQIGAEMKKVAEAISDQNVRLTVLERLEELEAPSRPRKDRSR